MSKQQCLRVLAADDVGGGGEGGGGDCEGGGGDGEEGGGGDALAGVVVGDGEGAVVAAGAEVVTGTDAALGRHCQ